MPCASLRTPFLPLYARHTPRSTHPPRHADAAPDAGVPRSILRRRPTGPDRPTPPEAASPGPGPPSLRARVRLVTRAGEPHVLDIVGRNRLPGEHPGAVDWSGAALGHMAGPAEAGPAALPAAAATPPPPCSRPRCHRRCTQFYQPFWLDLDALTGASRLAAEAAWHSAQATMAAGALCYVRGPVAMPHGVFEVSSPARAHALCDPSAPWCRGCDVPPACALTEAPAAASLAVPHCVPCARTLDVLGSAGRCAPAAQPGGQGVCARGCCGGGGQQRRGVLLPAHALSCCVRRPSCLPACLPAPTTLDAGSKACHTCLLGSTCLHGPTRAAV